MEDFSTAASGTIRAFWRVCDHLLWHSKSFKKKYPTNLKATFSNLSLRAGAKTADFKGLPQFYY